MLNVKLAPTALLLVLLSLGAPSAQAYSTTLPPAAPYLPAQYGLPDTIAGYKVLAVLTSDNTACMPPGAKRLILQTTQPTVEEFLETSDAAGIKAELEQKGFPEFAKWGVEIGGPDATFDKVVSENEDWNAFSRKYGCAQSIPALTGSDYQEFKAQGNGYAIYEDTDSGTFTNDNAQSVFLGAPASIGNRPKAVMFLNNVVTDAGSYYLLQTGLQFWQGAGKVIWTDTTIPHYSNQDYVPPIPYIASHTYWTSISYTNGTWWMCAKDNAVPSTYTCAQEPSAPGTTMKDDNGTSVFVETQVTNPNWYGAFSTPLKAWGAQIYRNGIGQNWSTQHHHTEDNCSTNYPPASALTGTMLGGGTGKFNLPYVPLLCP